MQVNKLIYASNDELLEWLYEPNFLSLAEEEVLLSAEIGIRNLTPSQSSLFQRRMTSARRQYNYNSCFPLDTK